MLYFNKYINIAINTLGRRNPAAETTLQRGSKLGFFIDDLCNADKVEAVGHTVQSAVVRINNEYSYMIGYGNGPLTGSENRLAECAKSKVVDVFSKSSDEISPRLLERAKAIAFGELSKHLDAARAEYLSYIVSHDTVGYGPFSILLEDKQSIEEIEINAPNLPINIYHVRYGRCPTNLRFSGESSFRHFINRFICDTEKELGEKAPIIDAQVENARVHAQIKPYALSGAVASIRLMGSKVVSVDYLAKNGTADFDALAYIWLAVESGLNLLIAGAPASGKTTMLSAIMSFVPHYEKIVTIEEDINELKMKLDINNSIALYGSKYGAHTTTHEQILNALRMRPNRIVIGEMRGEEARELFSGANLGVPFMTTMHSNSGGREVIKRLLIKPMAVEPRSLSMLDLVIYMRQVDIRKRVLSRIYEYRWLSRAETEIGSVEVGDGDSIEIVETARDTSLEKSSLQRSKVIEAYSKKSGISRRLVMKELEKRAAFLREKCGTCENPDKLVSCIQNYYL